MDDEPLILHIIGNLLSQAGYEVGLAVNGVEGLRKFQQEHWDVVLTDRAMPLMGGEEMTKAIKTSSPHTPVILITGLPECVKHPAVFEAVVAKPFQAETVLALAAEACGQAVRRAA